MQTSWCLLHTHVRESFPPHTLLAPLVVELQFGSARARGLALAPAQQQFPIAARARVLDAPLACLKIEAWPNGEVWAGSGSDPWLY